jgi:ATP-dependent helicase YprA (DUF1998 family)
LKNFVRDRLKAGELWPDAVLQLNPAFEPAPTLRELQASGRVSPGTARFFGSSLRLHKHQADALEVAQRGEPYIVSTGTGSGKSLTYLLPIFDQILGSNPSRHTVRAIQVYPMNALVNSQETALKQFRDRNWPDCPVRSLNTPGRLKTMSARRCRTTRRTSC